MVIMYYRFSTYRSCPSIRNFTYDLATISIRQKHASEEDILSITLLLSMNFNDNSLVLHMLTTVICNLILIFIFYFILFENINIGE